jgi:hypothetical protein
MDISRTKIIAGGIAALAVAGGGAAIAATQLGSPSQRSAAIVTDAAQQLGVQPSALSDALKSAEKKQVDAAVTAGDLTQAEGDQLKAAIDSGDVPLVGVGPGRGFGFGHRGGGFGGGPGHSVFGGLDAAATYLGVTQAELRTDLEGGKTLADVAKAQGTTVDGLVAAMVAATKKDLDADVTAGRLTQSQADSIASGLEQHVTDLVNGTLPARPDGEHGFRHFDGPRGTAPAFAGPLA